MGTFLISHSVPLASAGLEIQRKEPNKGIRVPDLLFLPRPAETDSCQAVSQLFFSQGTHASKAHFSSALAGRVYARDGNDCKPVNCTTQCIPACSASEKCILVVMNECGQCPMSQCVSLSALGISAAAADNANRDQDRQSRRVGLIAGLTTGLGVAAIIIVTLAGLVIYRRRKRRSEKEQQQQQTKDTDSYSPSSPLPPPPAAVVTPTVNAGSEAVSMNHLLPVTPTSWSQVIKHQFLSNMKKGNEYLI